MAMITLDKKGGVERVEPIERAGDQDKPKGITSIADIELDLSTPTAKKALYVGLLEAKQEALKRVERLRFIGTPLLFGVIAVSFVHIWESISVFVPEGVEPLKLPGYVHHTTAGAFTLAIDAVAAYIAFSNATTHLANVNKDEKVRIWFFYVLTFVLNAMFMVRHAPTLSADFKGAVLPVLDFAIVFILPAFIFMAMHAIEHAGRVLTDVQLQLKAEISVVSEMLGRGNVPNNASQRQNGRAPVVKVVSPQQPEQAARDALPVPEQADGPAIGGRRRAYELPDLVGAILDKDTFTRAEAIKLVGCGATTGDKLLTQAMEAGYVERLGQGTYKVIALPSLDELAGEQGGADQLGEQPATLANQLDALEIAGAQLPANGAN